MKNVLKKACRRLTRSAFQKVQEIIVKPGNKLETEYRMVMKEAFNRTVCSAEEKQCKTEIRF